MSSTPEIQSLRQEVDALRQRVAELEHANGANQALRESEARLQQFFSAAFEGIVIHDHGRILDANDALAAMIGVPRAALIGQHILSLVAPESQEAVRRILAQPNGERHEVIGLRNDGSSFPVAARAKDFPLQGRMVRVAVVQDLSDERRAQQQLVSYATQLETLSRRLFEVQEQERRHLARELHDEIGQMLTGLNLTLETVARQADDPIGAQIGEAQNLLRDLTGRVRELSLRLRPSMLDDLGLLPTVLWQIEGFSTTTQIHITVQHRGVERRFPTEIETAAYRVV
ncbi:MAG TPA: PAS domain S-box protein, partial [Gemmataceae bacterium]|nr:PAS domain S-box protein [Gemmataceae bacterium]